MVPTVSPLVYAILLGTLQGITEFLPVSSSAHLIVVSYFMSGAPLPLALNVALHVGTLAAVLVYFRRDWWTIGRAVVLRIVRGQRSYEADTLFPGLVVGTIPAAVVGLLFGHQIEAFFHNPVTVIAPLAVVGIVLWQVDKRWRGTRTAAEITIKDAFLIGVGQMCALIPGFSRSGSTIIAGRLLGLRREDAARYSFVLGTPALAGAAVLESKEILSHLADPVFTVGAVTSFLTGCLAIGLLLRLIRYRGFGIFAIYRVVLAVILLVIYLGY